ncbi:ATP-binding cassette domain-containing protein [Finegoldia magna]|uniref:Glutamine ABC transporter ATP-binding protein n=1 Tax=Finegoldia magna (strain ATCC 29328 / DSM 20472 / WAL 2508) TaxID=334413 RepID=B0S425_FINM2|nr:ABC transporter ATP-binding protein [Finegoldia magna]EFK94078.1 ABC transporter, ATP-binding protein [Finegoldia magna ACS-171-V-Col3]MDU6599076.1 ABC transporter ATP-binding protein [Finegoldia magna]UEA69602.1 ABC transporter ATP-binding protein [Finegoldia magna]BAG07428.1 glutamine ABC transporter ATP-binding protein [Finegoldia magna ATCC 29328]
MEILRFENVKFIKEYDDFTINKNEIVFIVGKSGSGKSTLLKLINNTLQMKSGSIFYKDTNILNIKPVELRRNIMMTSQENFLFDMTIKENFHEFYKLRDLENLTDDEIVKFLKIADFDVDVNLDVEKLSGGEKQRVFLAIALSMRPEVLLLDEPTSALDSNTAFNMMKNIVDYCKHNDITLVVVSHARNLVDEFADKTIDLGD